MRDNDALHGVGSGGGLCNHHLHLTPLTRMSYSYVSMRLGPHMRDDDDALSLSACILHCCPMSVVRTF